MNPLGPRGQIFAVLDHDSQSLLLPGKKSSDVLKMARIRYGRTGILVVDMQEGFVSLSRRPDDLKKNVSHFLDIAEEEKIPIWYIEMRGQGKTVSELNRPSRFSGNVVKKSYRNAFYNTSLNRKLGRQGITDVVVAGVWASQCVLSTARGAISKEFDVSTCPYLISDLPCVNPDYYLTDFRKGGADIFPSLENVVDYVVSRNR